MVHYIYKITCLKGSLKDHYYIGKHSTINENWEYYGSGTIIKDYYKKYGREQGVSITKEILEYNNSYEENLRREKEIIGNLWETDPLCLNLCGGGRGPLGVKITEETRQKLRNSHKGKTLPPEQKKKISESNKGRLVSQDTRKKISAANKGRKRKDTPWNKGKEMKTIRGKNNYQAKPINQYTLDGEFIKTWDCLIDIQRELKLKERGTICDCCRGKRLTSHGYKWSYTS